jgi:AraC-like DNA-binding protein
MEQGRRELGSARSRDVSIAEIGRRWGYYDAAVFCRAFRATHGTTPSAYRASRLERPTVAGEYEPLNTLEVSAEGPSDCIAPLLPG